TTKSVNCLKSCTIRSLASRQEKPKTHWTGPWKSTKSAHVKSSIFRSLSLAFRGLAPKPPQSLCALRGLGRLAIPQESSEHFSKYLKRSLIVECRKNDSILIRNELIDFFNTLKKPRRQLSGLFFCSYFFNRYDSHLAGA